MIRPLQPLALIKNCINISSAFSLLLLYFSIQSSTIVCQIFAKDFDIKLSFLHLLLHKSAYSERRPIISNNIIKTSFIFQTMRMMCFFVTSSSTAASTSVAGRWNVVRINFFVLGLLYYASFKVKDYKCYLLQNLPININTKNAYHAFWHAYSL